MIRSFHWLEDATSKIAASTSTGNVALKRMPTGLVQIEVYNAGTVPVFIRKGVDATVTAAVTDKPVAPGAMEVLTLNNTEKAPITHIAAITATGAADIYFTVGNGI